MKHIVIDARVIETSTGRYIQRIAEGINDTLSSDNLRFTLLVPSEHVSKWQNKLQNFDVQAADFKPYSLKEQTSFALMLARLKPDLVHFSMPQQPFLWWGPSVTTVHDMILVRYENIGDDNPYVYKFKKLIFRILLALVMYRSRAIITPTEFVRNDLANYFGKRYLPKIHSTPLAGEIPDVEPEVIAEHEGSSFLLYIGNMFPYKNVKQVIVAFAELRKTHPNLRLLIAGRKDEFAEQLEQYVRQEAIEDVYFLGFVTDGEKRWALQNTEAFMTASLAEGFCIPLLEAMIEGCPVIASNASCIPEVVGDGGILVDPHDTEAQVEIIESLLTDPVKKAELIERGYAHAASYSWERTASQTLEIYQKNVV